MEKKQTIKLKQSSAALSGGKWAYKVVSLTNRTTPFVGEGLSESEVKALIRERNTTVTIVGRK